MSLNLQKTQNNELLYAGFNQDSGCFAVGTDQGFRIYNCEPFKETFRRDFSSGGIGMVEMLFRCNILALVGGGRQPRYPPHKVMIWDDHQNRCIGELSFRSEVRAVRLRRDRVVVALERRVYIYNFADLTLVDHIETHENPRGLCAVCASPTNNVVACPGVAKGHVRIELYDHRKTTLIAAHEAALACIALNATGTRLATASEKGTLIRVYDTMTGDLLQELRRGADKADIYCLAFNPQTSMLACTSDKGTVHIFKLRDQVSDGGGSGAAGASSTQAGAASTSGQQAIAATSSATAGAAQQQPPHSARSGTGPAAASSSSGAAQQHSSGNGSNATHASSSATAGEGEYQSRDGGGGGSGPGAGAAGQAGAAAAGGGGGGFSLIKNMLPKYFSSEWSFAQFRVPDGKSICAFGSEPATIIVVGADGSFFKASFEKGGEATRVAYASFVKTLPAPVMHGVAVGMGSAGGGGGAGDHHHGGAGYGGDGGS